MGEAAPNGPGLGGPSPNGPGIGEASPNGPAIGEPGPPVSPNFPAGPLAGIPAGITFEIVDASAQDGIHMLGQPRAQVHLRAIIRDAYGNIVGNNRAYPCTPQFWLEDITTPRGATRATLLNDTVSFGEGLGVFTVAVRCAEHPEINSLRNAPPYNFETTNSALGLAPKPEPPKPGPGAQQRVLLGLLGAVLGGLLAYVIIEEADSASGGGGCDMSNPCVCSYGGDNCTGVGNSLCTSRYGIGSCVSEYPQCTCDANGQVSRVKPRATALQLHATPVYATRVDTSAATAARSHGFSERDVITAVFVGAFTAALVAIGHDARFEIHPWLTTSGGGLGMTARF
jgi:hypothetical protein